MKKIIKFSVGFAMCVFLYSCATNDDEQKEETPYYSFQLEDQPFLLNNYNNPSKRLVFKNQENEELSFIFRSFEEYKEDYSIGGGLGPVWGPASTAFFYDVRNIEFKFEQFQEPLADLEFTFSRFSDTLRGGIRFPLWNIDKFYLSPEPIDFDLTTFEMTIEGVTYNDVIIINSGETSVEYMIGQFPRNVNVLYYDLLYGLIGFDDLDGGEWRLQND